MLQNARNPVPLAGGDRASKAVIWRDAEESTTTIVPPQPFAVSWLRRRFGVPPSTARTVAALAGLGGVA